MIDIERLTGRWRSFPIAVTAALVALLLVGGIALVVQGETSYLNEKRQEMTVQAEILASTVDAALDFGDVESARTPVEALRANRQIRTAAIYDGTGRLVTGYSRASAPPATLAEAQRDGAGLIGAAAPVQRASKRLGTVYVAADPQPFSTRLRRYVLLGVLVLLAAVAAGVVGLAQVALARANRALTDANEELLHQIGERAKAEDQLRQAQKMQALGQLTGGIAHDFNNLLTVIQGSADMLLRPGLTEDKRRRFADAIVQAAARAAALTGQLLAFARRQPLQPEVIDVNAMIAGMTDLLDRALGERIEVVTELAEDVCTVEADRAQLVSAVLNIAVNARDAMPEGGTLVISTAQAENELGPMIALAVADGGTGMDAETIERAMEPFFTTKAAGKGTGLGLSQAYGFATQSGGDLRIESEPGTGTRVTILLPCSGLEALGDGDAAGETPTPQRTGSVLLVEDNEEVGAFAEALLRELGHRVTRARSGLEALDIARLRRFELVLSDVVMPAMSGLELAEELDRIHPGLPVILTTGYSDEIVRSGAGGRLVLRKPYRLDTLARALDEALGAAEKP